MLQQDMVVKLCEYFAGVVGHFANSVRHMNVVLTLMATLIPQEDCIR